MQLTIIIFLIAAVLVLAVLYYLTKSVVKVILYFSIIATLFVILIGVLVYSDVKDIQENFETSGKLFILIDGDKVVTGMSLTQDKAELLTKENMQNFDLNDYDSIKGDNYKLFIMKSDVINEIDQQEFTIGSDKEKRTIKKQTAIAAFKSDDALSVIANDFVKEDVPNKKEVFTEQTGIKTNEEAKGMIFGVIFQSYVLNNPLFLIDQLKKENIIIYPETIVFKLIKLVPASLVEKQLNQMTPK